ncbi:endolytic transglycosylase MltG [Natronosporangium hydrolyticum]|uniref:Endolytic murein transglycosylase n=1 Tax=Natronosporangium hydrolyticum TaxID=2811111 RepID=A0A895YSF5_9ACTN|nr:endolytic transglycosylase MltG [Natronosporangium hydrolyticum]QSB16948.1 endolytic transglycosylase MltG [Natronosporangium hydrolyticum]
MSELGLSFEEAPSKGRHRHRRSAKGKQSKPAKPGKQGKPRKSRGGKSLIAFMIVVLVLGGLGAGGWWGINWVQGALTAPDYEGAGTGSVTVEIREGQNLSDIAQVLYEADVVASPQAFVDAANENPQARAIQPGFYSVPQQLPAASAVLALLDTENRDIARVTIPEGLSSFRTFDLLEDQLGIPVEEFEAAAEDPFALGVPEFWYNRTDEQDVDPTIEGFLFPATYEFPPDPTAEVVLQTMVTQFLNVVEELNFVDRVESDRNIAPYEALIVASLAQAEAGVPDDIGRVARVAYNRLYIEQMPLEFDVTVNYWFELNGEPTKSSAEMTDAEMYDPDNPYNRGLNGLVPTPINNPGQVALEGAMDPPAGDWLFFVAVDGEGNSAFTSTYEEHCAAVQDAIDAGILNEQC